MNRTRKRSAKRKRSTGTSRRTREAVPAEAHEVEVAPAERGVELPELPIDTLAAEVTALLDVYGLPATVSPEVRTLVAYAVGLRHAWQDAEVRCIQRCEQERRAGSPERAASLAYRRAMATLLATARELAAMPARH